jgi:hypothetical protein
MCLFFLHYCQLVYRVGFIDCYGKKWAFGDGFGALGQLLFLGFIGWLLGFLLRSVAMPVRMLPYLSPLITSGSQTDS